MRGLKTTRSAWRNPLYAPRPRQVIAPVPRTPEQIEASRAEEDERIRQFFANRGITILKDREARTAVEGDTDLNHDNIEAAE